MSTIPVRFLIDREQKRVVFAEAGSDFVDVLFSLLTLPLASIVRLLEKQTGLVSLDTLYESVERLDAKHFQTEACKEMLLNPRSASARLLEDLKIKGIHDPHPRNFFTCSENDCLTQSTTYYTYNSKCLCSCCGKLMGKTLQWPEETSGEGGIFVNDKHNFMITDDLQVIPSSLAKGLSLFKKMQIKNASKLEERVIDFGKEEILNLLKRSFISTKGCLKCYLDNGVEPIGFASCEHGIKYAQLKEWNPKSAKIMSRADKDFVVGSQKYMITDNLNVSPLSIISAVGSGMNLSISDMVVKEISFDNVKLRNKTTAARIK